MTDTIAEIKEALERPAYIHEGMARRWLRFLLDEAERLQGLLEKAPHGGSHPYHQCGLPFGEDCDCWKSRIGGE